MSLTSLPRRATNPLPTEPCEHIPRIIAASATLTVGHGAFDVAIPQYPGNRLALPKGIMLIRSTPRVSFTTPA